MGSLRRFFGDFLSLVKESHPSETGQGCSIVEILEIKASSPNHQQNNTGL